MLGKSRRDANAEQVVKKVVELGLAVHVRPSLLYASFVVPCPLASQYVPFQATLEQLVNILPPFVLCVHVCPLVLYANGFVPLPPASHLLPFHATALQRLFENGVLGLLDHV
jgi:hypothetical protein